MVPAGLHYVTDDAPGIRRLGAPPRFRYVDPAGRAVRDPEALLRIRSLAIPPAWTRVWICPDEQGHIQATGRDARGRKQYRYHPRWREHRDADKFARMLAFGRALGRIRAATERDLARPGLPREKVLAAVVRLLELTHARIGNREYARQNRSYGLTTLQNRHVTVRGSALRFRYRGKHGIPRDLGVKDARLARIVRRCEELPGQRLFEYVDDQGEVRPVDSQDVNAYIRDIAGEDFSAKDFRTLAGTVLAARALSRCRSCRSKAQAKRTVRAVMGFVAQRLGNTVAVCRKCYVHPAVVTAWERTALGEPKPPRRAGGHGEEDLLRLVARVSLAGVEEAERALLDAAA